MFIAFVMSFSNISLACLLCFYANYAFAQKTIEQELAYWYKNPKEWKAYKQQVSQQILQQQQEQERHLESLKDQHKYRVKLQEMYDEILDRIDVADSLTRLYQGKKQAIHIAQKRNKHGLIFKIQIQLAQKHELDKFSRAYTNLTIEPTSNGKKRYLIGNFKIYEEAQALAEVLRNGGASAYLVAYKNGRRLDDFSEYLD